MLKRIISILLIFAILISLNLDTGRAYAASTPAGFTFTSYAAKELLLAESYGLLPESWYGLDMTKEITKKQLTTLIGNIRKKLKTTNQVLITSNSLSLTSALTVEQVLTYYYKLIAGYKFKTVIGLKGKTVLGFMKESGVYTEAKGEQKLKEKCSLEQASVFATRLITCIYSKMGIGSKGFLWKGSQGGNTVYLLGTIPYSSYNSYPLSNTVLDALQKSEVIATENDQNSTKNIYQLMEYAVYTDGSTLKDHISTETYQEVVKAATKLGVTEDIIRGYKPWFISLLISSLEASNHNMVTASELNKTNIKSFLLNYVQYSNKSVVDMESGKKVAEIFDKLSTELLEYLLNQTMESYFDLEGTTQSAKEQELLLESWKKGDIQTYLKYLQNKELLTNNASDEVVKQLLEEFKVKYTDYRNNEFAVYIDGLMKKNGSKTYFIMLDITQFAPGSSILELLKKKGYTFTQVK
ncbi:MAG: TraB/GumN family protein [Mobilitalea sp.]